MRWLALSSLAMVAALGFTGWAAVAHPAAASYSGPFEVVARTSATSTVIIAQGGRVPHGGQVVIFVVGSGFQAGQNCGVLPCVVRVSSGGLASAQAQIETASGKVVATASTGG